MPSFFPESHPVRSVVSGLIARGHRTLLAGGAVRDRLLGRAASDFDVATSATPREVAAAFPRVVPVGEKFGVVLVVVEGRHVEVATFRHDAHYDDGRHPVGVSFTTDPREDAARRDFTVNALFYDPETDEVLDYVDGREDLDAGVIRAVGDPLERFAEDRLRMLRAVRFAAQLDFEIDPATWTAVRALAVDIVDVAGERIRDELLKILTGENPVRGLRMLCASGLLEEILPEVSAGVGVPQPARFHPEGDVFTHTLAAVARLSERTPRLALAALLHDIGKPVTQSVADRVRFDRHAPKGAEMAEVVCRRLRLSREESDAVRDLVHNHLRFMSVREMREARLRRFLAGTRGEEHLALHRADCRGSHGDLSNWRFCREKLGEWGREPPAPERLLRGADLKALGLLPGPDFAPILREAEDLTLEQKLRTREEALEWLRARVERKEEPDGA
ncbi:MAG: CCA tRNA nucleotidyltransferase [Planctomycetota bacterium]